MCESTSLETEALRARVIGDLAKASGTTRSAMMLQWGRAALHSGDLVAAVCYLRSALDAEDMAAASVIETHLLLGETLWMQGPDVAVQAIWHFEKALEFAKETRNKKMECEVSLGYGFALAKFGRHKEARGVLLSAKRIAEKAANRKGTMFIQTLLDQVESMRESEPLGVAQEMQIFCARPSRQAVSEKVETPKIVSSTSRSKKKKKRRSAKRDACPPESTVEPQISDFVIEPSPSDSMQVGDERIMARSQGAAFETAPCGESRCEPDRIRIRERREDEGGEKETVITTACGKDLGQALKMFEGNSESCSADIELPCHLSCDDTHKQNEIAVCAQEIASVEEIGSESIVLESCEDETWTCQMKVGKDQATDLIGGERNLHAEVCNEAGPWEVATSRRRRRMLATTSETRDELSNFEVARSRSDDQPDSTSEESCGCQTSVAMTDAGSDAADEPPRNCCASAGSCSSASSGMAVTDQCGCQTSDSTTDAGSDATGEPRDLCSSASSCISASCEMVLTDESTPIEEVWNRPCLPEWISPPPGLGNALQPPVVFEPVKVPFSTSASLETCVMAEPMDISMGHWDLESKVPGVSALAVENACLKHVLAQQAMELARLRANHSLSFSDQFPMDAANFQRHSVCDEFAFSRF